MMMILLSWLPLVTRLLDLGLLRLKILEVDAVADALCSAIIMIDFVKQLRHGSNTVATLVQIMWHHIGVFTWVGEVWVIGSFPFLLLFRKLLWENCWRSSNKAIFLWVSGLHRVRDLGVALSEHGYFTSWQTIVLQADMIDMINAWLARNWLWFLTSAESCRSRDKNSFPVKTK